VQKTSSLSFLELIKIYKLLFKYSFKRKNKLILLGAGAVIDIGGPFTICDRKNISDTCCLTHHILNTGVYINPQLRLVQVIYLEICKQNQNANFEDIIDFIENAIVSVSYPNHLSYKHFYEFIAKNLIIKIDNDKFVINSFCIINISIKDKLDAYFIILKDLLVNIINAIRIKVTHYESKNNECFDKRFINWFDKQILYKHKSVNIYSLNYDSYIYNLIAKNNISIKLIKPNNLNVNKPVNYYNLHGSTKWKIIKPLNKKSYQFEYEENIENTDIHITEITDKYKLLSPIITGKDKVNKCFAEPFKQIINNFDKDIRVADEIYLIGYSFNDNHINTILRKSIEENPSVKVVVVNPGWKIPEFDDIITNDIKLNTKKSGKYSILNINHNLFEYEGSNMRFFYEKYIDYLVNPYNNKRVLNSNLPMFEMLKQRIE